jgi:predicted 3-demethylubiquinone-9 3-methyltransferase (glyoxalase superfamily)
MAHVQKIAPCLWFDTEAEEAARYYVSIFKNAKLGTITHYGKEGFEVHKKPAGSVLTVSFTLEGQEFTALNAGPKFKFNEAVSLEVRCESQAEIDYYWDKLRAGGEEKAQVCGWLKDKYGLSWQVAPARIHAMLTDKDPVRTDRVLKAVMGMKKLDLAALEKAYRGS